MFMYVAYQHSTAIQQALLSAFLYVLLLYDGVRNYCIKKILYINWTPQCEKKFS